MPFDLKDLKVTRNCLERSRSPRIGLFVGETSAPLHRRVYRVGRCELAVSRAH